jgi:hypothetical protein
MITDAQIKTFMERCSEISNGDNVTGKVTFSAETGSRYVRIVRTSHCAASVHCFLDRATGDVLKAASWKTPAKHARGNINDEHGGVGSMGPYGPAYLR